MATAHYTARVKENGSLDIPKETQEQLGLEPGDQVEVLLVTSTPRQIGADERSLAERFKGRVGRFRFEPADLSERTGEAYAELLARKYAEEQK